MSKHQKNIHQLTACIITTLEKEKQKSSVIHLKCKKTHTIKSLPSTIS